MKHFLFSSLLISAVILLSSWGYSGHKKINTPPPAALPESMSFLQPAWSTFLPNHASDADYRKNTDPNEAPKHYIDIDTYPGFLQNHKIPMAWDSVVALYGSDFVIGNGILPWSTKTAFDSVKACFARRDWDKAAIFAADLGHYVADGHMPLHITKNYNGQLSNQTGVHSRYETKVINTYVNQINYNLQQGQHIQDVSSYIFTYIYANYTYVDSVLTHDQEAYSSTGSYTSSAYLAAFWQHSSGYTTMLFKNASQILTDLIYTAWVDAGSPQPAGIPGEPEINRITEIFPNPAKNNVTIPIEVVNEMEISVSVMNEDGKTVQKFPAFSYSHGHHELTFSCDTLSSGVYFAVLTSGRNISVKKFIVAK